MHENKILTRYLVEFVAALFFYMLIQGVSLWEAHRVPEGLVRDLVWGSPVVPFLLMLAAVARHFRRIDEYQRLRVLENWAVTLAVTAGLALGYGLLENAGFPRLSMTAVCPVMGTVSAVGFLVRRMAGR